MRETEDSSSLYNFILENKHTHKKNERCGEVQLLHNQVLQPLTCDTNLKKSGLAIKPGLLKCRQL